MHGRVVCCRRSDIKFAALFRIVIQLFIQPLNSSSMAVIFYFIEGIVKMKTMDEPMFLNIVNAGMYITNI